MKICLHCECEFPIWTTIDGKPRNLASRKYCLSCSPFGSHNTRKLKVIVVGVCPCGKALQPRGEYQKRFCSITCYQKNKHSKLIEDWKNGKDTGTRAHGLSNAIRRYLLEVAEYRCSQCGWSERNKTTGLIPLTVDHKDGDWKNNAESNLQVLCPNCHALTSTYGILNKGKGRPYRQAWRNRKIAELM